MTFHLPVYSARASFSEIEPGQWAKGSINRKNLLTYLEICLFKFIYGQHKLQFDYVLEKAINR